MTAADLLDVALRRGLVVWDRSQKIEELFKGRKGRTNVCARNLLTKRVHPIRPRDHHYCREVMGTENIRLGQLL